MTGAAAGAWLAALVSLLTAGITGWLARRPTATDVRSVALSEMESALVEQRTMLDRAYVRIESLEREVVACEAGRHADRRKFSTEIDELRRTLRHLTNRDDPDAEQ